MLLSIKFWAGVAVGTLLSPFIIKGMYLLLEIPSLF